MTAKEMDVFAASRRTAEAWIGDLARRTGTTDPRAALRLLRATLHALRDVLSHDESAHLAAQLPILLRGIYYEGWRPSATPVAGRDAAHVLPRIARRINGTRSVPVETEVEEVFRLLNAHVSAGEIADIRAALQPSLRALWPEPSAERPR